MNRPKTNGQAIIRLEKKNKKIVHEAYWRLLLFIFDSFEDLQGLSISIHLHCVWKESHKHK